MVKLSSAFYRRISKIGLKKRWTREHAKVRIRNKISLEKAAIHAYLCGDGCIIARDDNRGYPHHDMRIWPDNRELAYFIVNLFKKEFNIEPKIRDLGKYFRVEIASKPTFLNLIKIGNYSTKNWQMPKNLTKEAKIEWIRAFFDCESNVDIPGKRIALKSINFNGLLQIKAALKFLKINSKVYGPYQPKNPKHSRYGILTLSGDNIQLYKRLINFHHPAKKEKLNKI
jgi:hypothetical protein